MVKPKPIGELVARVLETKQDYESAETGESVARSRRCSALNNVNEAQRALDAALAELRKDAPRDSDWGRARK